MHPPKKHISNNIENTFDDILNEFKLRLSIPTFTISQDLQDSCLNLLSKIDLEHIRNPPSNALTRAIKKKLKLEELNSKRVINGLAKKQYYFNSIEKKRIQNFLCDSQLHKLKEFLLQKNIDVLYIDKILSSIRNISAEDALRLFKEEYTSPINRRTKKIDITLRVPLVNSIFACYFYERFNEPAIHSANSELNIEDYDEDYWSFIHNDTNGIYHRNHALTYFDLSTILESDLDYNSIREIVLEQLQLTYENSDNHTYVFLRIPSKFEYSWKLALQLTLFAEKFIEKLETVGYFKPHKIYEETYKDSNIEFKADNFQKLNEGFLYKDCFCLYNDEGQSAPDLLLAFKKDVKDSSKIPCPSCRSFNVRGNSYPSLGIKSWECKNLLCSERSMSNRGKRYSFESLLKQRSIECPDSQIDKSILRRWKRDIIYNVNEQEIYEYVIKSYSLPEDTIHFYNIDPINTFGRNIKKKGVLFNDSINSSYWADFEKLDFFKRWHNLSRNITPLESRMHMLDDVQIIEGDCEYSLENIANDSIGGAVTSPPYYNAREYSQYSNIYVYLTKMELIAKQILKKLKPGAYYLFNIFDYFDNENTVALSAMGQKRLILSAYITYSFEKLGFKLVTNIPWDKGEIEGNRAYNAGNNSPYYQSPLNCWEHVLVFQKFGEDKHVDWESVLKSSPVIKMVRGENKFGHTAPFPITVPQLLTSKVDSNETILDPFGGSGTTAIASLMNNQKALLCEAMPSYVELIKDRLSRIDTSDTSLLEMSNCNGKL